MRSLHAEINKEFYDKLFLYIHSQKKLNLKGSCKYRIQQVVDLTPIYNILQNLSQSLPGLHLLSSLGTKI